jgi:uncharacterized protein YyaL (SSP411 family)/aryl-alcohol dehydrogenase-like predicted oxidoreductase
MTTDRGAAGHTNRLANETSPYLLQHAHNPVDWYPWSQEALARARATGRPILLSIGYSACHWCHVMERESFEDERIASLMNDLFVCIKVDREERPDLDEIYMAATLALNGGQGGWPMTVFLTPDQKPFFAGTYFPPTERYGRPGFATVLSRIGEEWRRRRGDLESQADRLSDLLRAQVQRADALAVSTSEIDAAVAQLGEQFDPVYGGFGPAPKFPPATALSLLLRYHDRCGDARALQMVRKTLDAMARGGIYDHIGGGFARYSTDERWLVPHFEKMLYDNALLARVYLEAYQVTGEGAYRQVAGETLDYVLREMTGPGGGFYSATDADSEGEEGRFYVWSPAEIIDVLGAGDGERFCAYYDITDAGNWEGKSIPNTPGSAAEVAAATGRRPEELEQLLRRCRARVYEARRRRIPPGLDDKILTAWNGLMIGAMAEGYRVLGDRRHLEAAERAARFLLGTSRRPDGGLLRTYRNGTARLDGYLEDHAFLCDALIDLYEAGGTIEFLTEAERLARYILAEFGDDTRGGFYSTARGHERLLLRHRDGKDGAMPSANAVAASALARLSLHLNDGGLREAAERAVQAHGVEISQHPTVFAKSLAVVDFLTGGPVELALIGRCGEAGYDALRQAMGRPFLRNRIIAYCDPETDHTAAPLTAGKSRVGGRPALYVCRDFACQAPCTEAGEVEAALAAHRHAAPVVARPIIGGLCAGRATVDGTDGYRRRLRTQVGDAAWAPFGSTGLTVSRFGFGGYRVDDGRPEHRQALEQALRSGVNLVDTSTNYTDGGSERLVGAALRGLVGAERIRREEIVVVSKVGYVQGANMTFVQQREAAGRPYREMVRYMDGCWHCTHPEFLADQLDRSRARLGLETLDVCLLHNPEYFLLDAQRRGGASLADVRGEFYRRLGAAFRFFEDQVAAGTIGWYGVSSNTVSEADEDPQATSLTRILAAARDAGGADHHCRVLQLPMNLLEPPANRVLEVADRERVAVLVNRPLNAIVDGRVVRLADVPVPDTEIDLDAELAAVGELEAEWRCNLAPALRTEQGSSPADFFPWAEQLRDLRPRIQNAEQWEQVAGQTVVPTVMHLVRALDDALSGELARRWHDWRDRYLPPLQRLLEGLRGEAMRKSHRTSLAIAAIVDPFLPAERRPETLARKALWVLASTPAVTVVLNGMRRSTYVDDAVSVLRWSPLPDAAAIYRALRDWRGAA